MGKIAKIAAGIGLVALSATGVGAALGSAGAFALFGGSVGAGVLSGAGTLASTLALGVGSSTLLKQAGGSKAKTSSTGGYRSAVQLSANRSRWLVIGETAMPAQLIYFGTSGTNNDQLSMIFAHSCAPISAFTGLAINNVATSFPTPAGAYSGILAIETATGTQTSNPFSTVHGGLWGATDIGRGLAMSHFRWTYDATKLASGLPQNIQFTGKGLAVYDPRFDSTRGGSGTMRADNPATWAYSYGGYDCGRNPAAVEITYRLGIWQNGLPYAGMFEDPANIDFASYIAAANVCDQVVGGKPRYRIDGIIDIGPGTNHNDNLARIHATCAGRPIDTGGLIGFWAATDDTAASVMTLTDDDWRDDIKWEPLPEGQIRNTGTGSYIDPTNFYIANPYPEVAPADLLTLDNGVRLPDDLNFEMVQDVDQARRLTNIRLRESRQGMLRGITGLKALGLRPMDVVTIPHPRFTWSAPKFRVERMALGHAEVQLGLRAIQSSDYADLSNASVSTTGPLPTLGYMPAPAQPGATNNTPYTGSTAPPSPYLNQLWVDTSGGAGGTVLKIYTGATWLRIANDTIAAITATASTSSVAGSASLGSFPGTITSTSVTVTPAGGSGYTFDWAWSSGDVLTVTSPEAATTTFSASCGYGQSFHAIYSCTVTAASGATAVVFVEVTITETHGVAISLSSYAPSGTSSGTPVTTGSVTATASGGTGPYTYQWYLDSYSGPVPPTIAAAGSATTTFSQAGMGHGDTETADFYCIATDTATGFTRTSAMLTATFTRT